MDNTLTVRGGTMAWKPFMWALAGLRNSPLNTRTNKRKYSLRRRLLMQHTDVNEGKETVAMQSTDLPSSKLARNVSIDVSRSCAARFVVYTIRGKVRWVSQVHEYIYMCVCVLWRKCSVYVGHVGWCGQFFEFDDAFQVGHEANGVGDVETTGGAHHSHVTLSIWLMYALLFQK